MPSNEVDIKIKTSVDGDELESLNKQLKQLSAEETEIKVGADANSATDKLREVQKKAKEIAAEKTLVNIGVATKGLEEIKKIKSEYNELKNMLPPNLRVQMDNAAEDRIDEIRKKINDLDGLSPQIKTMIESGAIDELQAIQTATDNLDGSSPKIKPTVDDSEAISSLQNIQNQAEGISGLEQGVGGLLATAGASQLLTNGVETATNMDKAWRNWVGSLQQSGMGLDQAKKKADGFYDTVNNLASTGQSSDSLFKNVAGLVINLNNKVSDSTLGMTEKVVAGYEMLGGRTGATMYEMEKELKNFLSTGDLGLMEDTLSSLRDPEKWKGLLEGADTVDERIKILQDMLQEEGIMGALDIDAPSKSIDQLKALFDASMTNIGTTLINMIKPIADGFMWLDELTKGASTSILSTVAVVGLLGVGLIGLVGALGMVGRSFTATLSGIKGFGSILKGGGGLVNALKGAGLATQTAELGANTAALTANTAALEANNLARATSAAGAAKGINGIGAVGSAAGGAAPGAAAGATGMSAISASITTMLVPLIAISAVIAIMIPIVAGLAIEVLLFVRLIGEVVKALRFDKLNLTSAIEGIKQIGLAMWELLKAFTVLTAINIVNVIYTATGGIINTSLALAQFWVASKEIEALLNELSKMNIDDSSVNKINQISLSIKGIASAMGQLTGLNLSGLGVMLTGGMQAIRQNIRHMTDIGKEIQAINIPSIPQEKTDMINKLAATIKQLSEASKAVDEANGWFQTKVLNTDDVTGMQATLRNLAQIAENINNTKIPTVAKEKVDLVKALSNVIKPLAEASKSVDESNGMFQTSVLNADDVTGMEATLRNLSLIAENINKSDIPPVDKAKIDAVRNINNVIQPITQASKAISDNWASIVATPAMAVPFSMAISALYIINQKLNSLAFSIDSSKTEAINSLKSVIQRVAEVGLYLNQNTGNISAIVSNQASLSGAIQSLYVINQKINSMPFQIDTAKINMINSLKTAIQAINNALSTAAGVQAAAQNMGSKITTGFKIGAKNLGSASVTVVSAAISAVKNRYDTMQSAGNALGAALVSGFRAGAGINSPIAAIISGMNDTISFIRSLTSDFYTAGSALGANLTAGMTDEEKADLNVNDLLRQNSGSVMDIYYGSSVNWVGGAAGSPFEEANNGESMYPSGGNNIINNFNSLITERDVANYVMDIIEDYNDREASRS